MPLDVALTSLEVNESNFYQWMRAAETDAENWHGGGAISEQTKAQILRLSQRVARARAVNEQRCVEAIHSAIGVVGKDGVPQWRPALEWLKVAPHTREKYREYREVNVTGGTTVTVEQRMVRQLSDSQLREVAGADWAALCPPSVEGELVSSHSSMEGTRPGDAAGRLPEGDTGPDGE